MNDKDMGDALEKGLGGFIGELRKDSNIPVGGRLEWSGLVDAVGSRTADKILGNAPKPFTEAEMAVRMAAMKKHLDDMGL